MVFGIALCAISPVAIVMLVYAFKQRRSGKGKFFNGKYRAKVRAYEAIKEEERTARLANDPPNFPKPRKFGR